MNGVIKRGGRTCPPPTNDLHHRRLTISLVLVLEYKKRQYPEWIRMGVSASFSRLTSAFICYCGSSSTSTRARFFM